jgi:hypothetical protein
MQVLNSQRSSTHQNYNFSNHRLFSTIFLLQKQRLNHRNYFKLELSMAISMSAANTDINMHAKPQII